MGIEFRLLGPVEACLGDRQIVIGYRQLRCMLAVLLIEANRAVPADDLADRVWGTRRLPHRPRRAVQHSIALVRRALALTMEARIDRKPTGYQLTLDTQTVDLHRFRARLNQAATERDQGAAVLFEQALDLWRGEPFSGLDTPWLNAQRDILKAQRHAAQLDLTDIQLRQGRHTLLLADLADQVQQHPLDERLAGQYLLALYRSGRQAHALQHYQHLRHRLAEELGADPSPPLQQLYQQILVADHALTVSATRREPVPRQLPAQPGLFVGRTQELRFLTTALDEREGADGALRILAISGIGGVGKTWLALQWAHQHLHRFKDGQLYVNLRGFDPSGQPLPVSVALHGLLDAFGVDAAAIPADLDAQVGLYRSLLTGKHVLIVLDNAYDTDQVVSLLPGTPTCMVLVTSRRRLTGLVGRHGARAVQLRMFSPADAHELLASHLGADRLAAEPQPAKELLDSCAGLPLALGVVAARAAAHPDFPIAVLAGELHDRAGRLDALDGGELADNVRAVLSWSFNALQADTVSVFCLLGLAPGPDISTAAASSLAALPMTRTRTVLRELENASLIQQHAPGRYLMHDLVRLFAVDQAHGRISSGAAEPLRRLAGFYLHTAYHGDRMLFPSRDAISIGDPPVGCHFLPLQGKAEAFVWFTAEQANILAIQRVCHEQGWYTEAWLIARTLTTFHWRRWNFQDDIAAWTTGAAAADALSDPVAQVWTHRALGHAYSRARQPVEALQYLRRALRMAVAAHDLDGQAGTHQGLAWALAAQGNYRHALHHATRALRLYETLDIPMWTARALNSVGLYQAQAGDYTRARESCKAALALARQCRYQDGEANTLDSLGYIAHRTGRNSEAVDYHKRALRVFRDLGHAYQEANTLANIAQTYAELGDEGQARAALRQALELYEQQGRLTDANRIRRQFGMSEPRPVLSQ